MVYLNLNLEASKSPEVSIFQRFKKHWPSISKSEKLNVLDIEDDNFKNELKSLSVF